MQTKKISNQLTRSAADFPDLDIRRVTLSNGRMVALREMTGDDQAFLEKITGEKKTTESSATFQMISRISVAIPEENIESLSPSQIGKLSVKNLTRLAKAYAEMNAEPSEEDSEGK